MIPLGRSLVIIRRRHDGASGALTTFSRRVTKLLGQAIGLGLEFDIRCAYALLMNHFEKGDRVFLFGFSRGAYMGLRWADRAYVLVDTSGTQSP